MRNDGAFQPLHDDSEFAELVAQGTHVEPIPLADNYDPPAAFQFQPAAPQETAVASYPPQTASYPAQTAVASYPAQTASYPAQTASYPAQTAVASYPPPTAAPQPQYRQAQAGHDVEMQTFPVRPEPRHLDPDGGDAVGPSDIEPIEYEGNRYDVLFCRTTNSSIAFFGYRRIVLYTTLCSWFVASWLFGIAYFVSGGGQNLLWWTLLLVLGGSLIATALTVANSKAWKERYIDCVWYGMSFALMLVPCGFAIAASYVTSSYAEGLCSTALLMVIIPMAYCWLEAILRCVAAKVFKSTLSGLN